MTQGTIPGPGVPEVNPRVQEPEQPQVEQPQIDDYDPASSGETRRPAYSPEKSAAKREKLIKPQAVTPEEATDRPVSKEELEAKPQVEVVPQSGELALPRPEQQAGGQAVTPSQVLSKIAGYQSTQQGVVNSFINDPNFPNNLMNFVQNGNPNDASMWQAVLLLKVYRVLAVVFG